MSNLASLRETRASRLDALRAITAKAASESRDLNDQEQGAFETGQAEITRIDRSIRNAEFLAEAERHAHADPVTGEGGDMAELEARYNPGKALAEYAERGQLTGAEAEYAAEYRSGRPGAFAVPASAFFGERRALTTAAPAAGPGRNLIATQQGALIDRPRPTLATETLGATVLSGLTGFLDLPKLKESGAANWVAEHGAATRTDPKFAKISMGPKTVTAEYELSRRMLIQTAALDTILRNDLSYLLRQALDTAAIVGGGTNEPVGILSTAGLTVQSIGANGGPLSTDVTADMIGAIDDALSGSRGFLINQKTRTAAMKLKDGESRPIGVPAVFHGEPLALSQALPSNGTKGTGTNLSSIIYGIWSDLIIGYWSAVDIVPNPYHSDVASKGGLLLHAFLDADVAVRHVESFVAVTDVQ